MSKLISLLSQGVLLDIFLEIFWDWVSQNIFLCIFIYVEILPCILENNLNLSVKGFDQFTLIERSENSVANQTIPK